MKLRTVKLDFATLTFEHARIMDPINGITSVVIYRPPPSQKNKLKASDFFEEFDNFAIYISTFSGRLLMLGDFNVHIDKPDLPDVKKFNKSLVSSGLYQHSHERSYT